MICRQARGTGLHNKTFKQGGQEKIVEKMSLSSRYFSILTPLPRQHWAAAIRLCHEPII